MPIATARIETASRPRRATAWLTLVAAGMLLSGCIYPPPRPVVVVPPPPPGAIPYGSTCFAGFYTCPASGPVGAPCACSGIGAPSYGNIR